MADTESSPRISKVNPNEQIVAKSYIGSAEERAKLYTKSISDAEGYWAEIAESFHWNKKWTGPVRAFNYNASSGPIFISWFAGAETNICFNALDRHVSSGKGEKVAFIYEGNDGESSRITYQELLDQTCQLANVLKKHGVKAGDKVTLYLPMIILAPVAMLAVTRIGAVLNTVFGGFSSTALAARVLDCGSKLIITADSVMRGPKPVDLKKVVNEACEICVKEGHTVETVLCWERRNRQCPMVDGRDFWLQDEMEKAPTLCDVAWRGAEDELFLLYTSGSTGKPKGVVHTTAGYMVYAATTTKFVFDIHDDDVYWCTADIGWITGHSYVTFGPLLNAATSIIFEGVPTHPDAGIMWKLCEKHRVTVFYTAPTAIRALMKFGDHPVQTHDLAALRVLGSVGEPINEEAWKWYYSVVGGGRCSIVDTWWQTETGGIMITPLPGCTPMKPSSATLPFFGVEPAVIDEKGNELAGPTEGFLVLKVPHPGICRSIYGDHQRYEETYFKVYPGYYFTGDGCRRDEDGYYWITGRVDDVLNVSGHRLGTAEIENAINTHPAVIESAVVGVPHEIKGIGIYAFVTVRDGVDFTAALKREICATVRQVIGPIATPDHIHPAPGLPKTRSGKIMRRILRKIATNELDQLGDISTLADPSVVQRLVELRPDGPASPLSV
jgi:acetyl-CoA synthetase